MWGHRIGLHCTSSWSSHLLGRPAVWLSCNCVLCGRVCAVVARGSQNHWNSDIIIRLRAPVLLRLCSKVTGIHEDLVILLPLWPTSPLPTLQLVLNNDLSTQQAAGARNSVGLFSRLGQAIFYLINKSVHTHHVYSLGGLCLLME